nr:MAG TPA: hypothetical protein [Caudoviricetes sp.]
MFRVARIEVSRVSLGLSNFFQQVLGRNRGGTTAVNADFFGMLFTELGQELDEFRVTTDWRLRHGIEQFIRHIMPSRTSSQGHLLVSAHDTKLRAQLVKTLLRLIGFIITISPHAIAGFRHIAFKNRGGLLFAQTSFGGHLTEPAEVFFNDVAKLLVLHAVQREAIIFGLFRCAEPTINVHELVVSLRHRNLFTAQKAFSVQVTLRQCLRILELLQRLAVTKIFRVASEPLRTRVLRGIITRGGALAGRRTRRGIIHARIHVTLQGLNLFHKSPKYAAQRCADPRRSLVHSAAAAPAHNELS